MFQCATCDEGLADDRGRRWIGRSKPSLKRQVRGSKLHGSRLSSTTGGRLKTSAFLSRRGLFWRPQPLQSLTPQTIGLWRPVTDLPVLYRQGGSFHQQQERFCCRQQAGLLLTY